MLAVPSPSGTPISQNLLGSENCMVASTKPCASSVPSHFSNGPTILDNVTDKPHSGNICSFKVLYLESAIMVCCGSVISLLRNQRAVSFTFSSHRTKLPLGTFTGSITFTLTGP